MARMTPAAQILNAVLLPILTLYTVIVYGAALAMIIGMLFLPIGAIMFVAGGGAQFFTNWTNIMLASLLTLLLFPIMWAVTTQIAIITPVQSFVNQWETAASQFTDEMNAIAADSTQLTLTPDGVRKFVSEQFDAAWQRLSLTLQQGLNVIQLIFAIVVGLVAAFSLIFLLQTYIMKFIAGVIAAVAAFRPLLTFGGGGRSRASSTSTQNKTGDTTTRGGGGGDDGSSGGGDGGTPPRSTGPARARGGARAASASTGSPRPTAAAGGAGRATVQAPRTIDDGESDHIYAPSPDEVAKYSGRAGKRGS